MRETFHLVTNFTRSVGDLRSSSLAKTDVHPCVSGKMVSRSDMSNPNELSPSTVSEPVSCHSSHTDKHFRAIVLWLISIPFGVPEDPDVKIT